MRKSKCSLGKGELRKMFKNVSAWDYLFSQEIEIPLRQTQQATRHMQADQDPTVAAGIPFLGKKNT